MMRSTKMMWGGAAMLFAGWAIVFAIVLEMLPASYFLNLFGYGMSLVGLLVGLIGILDHVRPRRD